MDSVKHSASAKLVYDFERGMMAPSFVMCRRRGAGGFQVAERQCGGNWKLTWVIGDDRVPAAGGSGRGTSLILSGRTGKKSEGTLQTFSLNYNSHDQLKEFFYETLKCPVRYQFDKGEMKVTANREALGVDRRE